VTPGAPIAHLVPAVTNGVRLAHPARQVRRSANLCGAAGRDAAPRVGCGAASGPAGARVQTPGSGVGYGTTRAAPCCGVVGMWPRPMRLRNTQYVHAWYASTSGSVHSAIQDMISSVYGVELAFSIVRL